MGLVPLLPSVLSSIAAAPPAEWIVGVSPLSDSPPGRPMMRVVVPPLVDATGPELPEGKLRLYPELVPFDMVVFCAAIRPCESRVNVTPVALGAP